MLSSAGSRLVGALLLLSFPAAATPSGGGWSLASGGFASSGLAFASAGGTSLRYAVLLPPGGGRMSSGGMQLSGGLFAQGSVPFAASGLSESHPYPVPWRSSLHAGLPVTFTNLSRRATVKVYTLGGELVRALEKEDPGAVLLWDRRNGAGQEVASGVYLYTIEDPESGGRARGKLMVIR